MSDQEKLVGEVERALRALKVQLRPETGWEPAVLDGVYSFPCGVLGVQCCDGWEELSRGWEDAQREFGSIVRRWLLERPIGPDAYLLFILSARTLEEVPPEERNALVQTIQTSRSECLKHIVVYDGDEWTDRLRDLTFVPIAPAERVPESGQVAIGAFLRGAGLPDELAEDLLGTRPGAELMAQRILEGDYGAPPEAWSQAGLDPLWLVRPEPQLPKRKRRRRAGRQVRLQAVRLPNFRSFRAPDAGSAPEIDLSSDITLLYGENGSGKTCLVQALEWAICGGIEDLAECLAREAVGDAAGSALRNMGAEGRPAEVHLMLDGDALRCVEDDSGSRDLEEAVGLGEREAWRRWLGIDPEPWQRTEDLRALCRDRVFLGQGQMKQLLSARGPMARFDHFASLLGGGGIPRARRKLRAVVDQLRARRAELQEQRDALEGQARNLRTERRSAAEMAAVAGVPEPAATPEASLRHSRQYHAAAGVVAPGLERADDEGLAEAITRVLDHLAGRRRVLEAAVHRARRRRELSKRVESTRARMRKCREALAEAERRCDSAVGTRDQLRKELAALEASLPSAAERRAESLRRRRALEWWVRERPLQVDRIAQLERVADALARVASEEEGLRQAVGAGRAHLSAARADLEAASGRVREAQARAAQLSRLATFLEEHPHLEQRLRTAERRRKEAETALQVCQAAASHDEPQVADLAERVARLEHAVQEARAGRDRSARILAWLRDKVQSSQCPLCSHTWPNREALLAAIDQQIGAPSSEEARLARQLRQAGQALAEAGERADASRRARRAGEDRLAKLASELDQLREWDNYRRSILAKWRLPATGTPNDLAAERERSREGLGRAEQEYRTLRCRVDELEEKLKAYRSRRVAVRKRLDELQMEREQLAESARQAEERLAATPWLSSLDGTQLLRRLEEMAAEDESEAARAAEADKAVAQTRAQLSVVLEALASAGAARDAARSALQEEERVRTEIEGDLRVLAASGEAGDEEVQTPLQDLQRELANVEDLIGEGRAALTAFEATCADRRLKGLEAQLRDLEGELAEVDSRMGRSRQWQEATEERESLLEREQIRLVQEGLEPLRDVLRRIHRRLSWHPLFGDLDWSVDQDGVRFWAIPSRAATSDSGPARRLVQAYLNEAQQNLVALSAFLAGALSRGGQLRLAVLDDPVQAMDELNTYGLLDLLRVLADHMQIIVTTGRSELFHLARAKFSCLNGGTRRRFRAYRLTWGGTDRGTVVESVG